MADFVAIDVETANPFMGSICQLGAIRFRGGQEESGLDTLVNPGTWFDEVNVSIHGIDAATVRGAPAFAQVLPRLKDLAGDLPLVCHTHFDRVALHQACTAAGLERMSCRWLDSARVARRAWSDVSHSGYGLAPLAQRLGIDFRHHHAAEDARAAGLILLHAMRDSGLTLEQWFDRVERPVDLAGDLPIRRDGGGEGPLFGERIVFTGALSIERRAAADRAAGLGAAVEPNVTRKTTMLVLGDQDLQKLAGHDKSAKHRKVEEMIAAGRPIRIVAETDFMAF